MWCPLTVQPAKTISLGDTSGQIRLDPALTFHQSPITFHWNGLPSPLHPTSFGNPRALNASDEPMNAWGPEAVTPHPLRPHDLASGKINMRLKIGELMMQVLKSSAISRS